MGKTRKSAFFITAAVLFLLGCSAAGSNSAASKPTATPAASHSDTGEKPKAADPSRSSSVATSSSPSQRADSIDSSMDKVENRCGWFSNPTPANAWLNDNAGEWLISAQGGYQADGDWPDFPDDKWVKTNGNYGYGCACMKVTVDKREMRILKIVSATAKPLADCRRDKSLVEPSE